MKYANLVLDEKVKMVNAGDYMQILAIENVYNYMGIQYENVVRIKISELSTYDGEYVVLPINYPFYGYYNLSSKIKPVYLGISIIDNSVSKGLKFDNFQPIGCRDYHTFHEVQSAGLDAYYGGCLTICFPRRKKEPERQKVFFVDVPHELMGYIPQNLKDNGEFLSQVFYNEDCVNEKGVKKIYEKYCKEATLVVTSRIHCAMPCLAAGIPVIFVCNQLSFRYCVLQSLIPIYTRNQFKSINWEPEKLEIEDRKTSMLNLATNRIQQTFAKYNEICELSMIYESPSKIDYTIDTVYAIEEYIKEKRLDNIEFEYALWGVTQIAESAYKMITEKFPKAKMIAVIDMYRETTFHGRKSVHIDKLKGTDSVVFVTAGAANKVADQYFLKYGIKHFLICYNGFMMSDGKRVEMNIES